MILAIRKYFTDFIAIIVLFVISAGVGGYILDNQRLRFPLIEDKPFKLKAEFSTAQAVTPGQGQTIRVSGVRIGDIAKVNLKGGRAVVTMDIDTKFAKLVHTDASALLRPKTNLKDMFIEITPGSTDAPVAAENWTIPVANTLPDVNPDEIYAALDVDTRDYLRLLVGGAGQGLDGRGGDLQEVFRRFEPTHRDIALVTGQVAKRHRNLKRLVNSLALLNGELANKDDDVAELVSSSAVVFRAFASEEQSISRAVRALPGALSQTTETFGELEQFAKVLKPAADELRPAFRSLNRANKAIQPFAKEAAPIIRDQIRPFVRAGRPVVRDLAAPAKNLAAATPDLTKSFVVLNHLFNMLAYNKDGREAPGKATRDEGYLFWLAWLGHIGPAVFGTSDANGPFRPVTLGATCSTMQQIIASEAPGQFDPLVTVVGQALMDENLCGSGG